MAHIVILSKGITSYLNACFAFTSDLKARGHHVTFVCAEARAKDQVEKQGFDFRLLEEESALERARRKALPRNQPIYKRYFKRRAFIRAYSPLHKHRVEGCELDALLAELKPDLLLIDSELYHQIIAVATTADHNIPTLLLETHFAAPRAPGIPILYSDFVPKGTLWDRPRAAATWSIALAKRHARFGWERFFYAGTDRISTLRALAKKRGFDWGENVLMNQWRLLTFRHVPTLYLCARELDFPRPMQQTTDAKSNAAVGIDSRAEIKIENGIGYYVGPMVMLDRTETQTQDARYVEVMQRLADKRQGQQQAGGKERPLIFCGMGSIFANFGYFQRVIAAVAQHPEWDLVLAIGRRLRIEQFGTVPDNVYIFQSVPQIDLLKRADIMLNHGGIGSIRESIFLGVPMLIYSHGHLDQNGCAARIAYHGLGLCGDIRSETPAEIAAKINRVLTDDRFRKNVETMRTHYQAYGGAGTAIRFIEKMIE